MGSRPTAGAEATLDEPGARHAFASGLVAIKAEAAKETIRAPLVVLSQAVRGLVQNALDADVTNRGVDIELKGFASHWLWEIYDQGEGMSPNVLKRVSEPFFTTKPTGKGMGLGVFLARNVIERLEGSIDFQSSPEAGTRVTIRLPRRQRPESNNP